MAKTGHFLSLLWVRYSLNVVNCRDKFCEKVEDWLLSYGSLSRDSFWSEILKILVGNTQNTAFLADDQYDVLSNG